MPPKPKKSPNTEDDQRKTQFGKNISALRKKAGYTSALDFAIDKDLNASQIARWEAGKGNPGLLNVCKLAEALGVTPSELLKGV